METSRLSLRVPVRGVYVQVDFISLGILVLALALPTREFLMKELYVLGWVGLVVVHELGHALAARREGCEVYSLVFHPFGGLCQHEAPASEEAETRIAWGGVLAQSLLLAASLPFLFFASGDQPLVRFVLDLFFRINLGLILLNSLPLPFFDGGRMWRIFKPRRVRRPRGGEGKVLSFAAGKRRIAKSEAKRLAGEVMDEARRAHRPEGRD
jgi:Zn-dependent protease